MATLMLLLFSRTSCFTQLLQSTQLYKWKLDVNKGNSPPNFNINGYLHGNNWEVNVKLLSISANRCGLGGALGAHTITLGMVQFTCGVLTLPQVDLLAPLSSAQAPQCFTGSA